MKIPGFIPTKHPDRIITQVQNNLNNTLIPVTKHPLLNGNNVVVTFPNQANTDILVTHGLGNSKGVTWLIGTADRVTSVYLSPNTNNIALNPRPEQQILLRCSTSGATSTAPGAVVTLYFYNSENNTTAITSGTTNAAVVTTTVPTTLPPSGPAGGDLSGTYPNPKVVAIQGNPVSATTPTSSQVLEFDGTSWTPTTLPSGVAGGNPSASIGLSVIDGSATTYMRSDAAPALSQAIVPTWTGLHTFSGGLTSTAGTTALGTTNISGLATLSDGLTETGALSLQAQTMTLTGGSTGEPLVYNNVTTTWAPGNVTASYVDAAGSTGQVQYNGGTTLAAGSGLTWTTATSLLTATNATVTDALIVGTTSLLTGAVTVDSTITQGTASTAIQLIGNQGATGTGVLLNTGTTTMTTGLPLVVQNNSVQQFALSGYGHPLYAFAGHQPVTAGNVSFVTGSGAVLGGTTTATVSVPTAAVGFFGIMVFNVFSSTSAAVTAVTGSTGTWVLLTDSLVSGTDVITSVFYCTSVAASGVATGTLSHASTYTDVAVGAYSNVGSILTAGAQTATGTGTTIAVSLTQTTPNSLIVAAMGAQYQQTLTASVGTLRETTDSGGGGATGSAVALVDITSDTPSTLSPAVTGVNSMAWGAYAVELKPGPGIAGTGFGAMTNITYTGSDAAFGMQFESGPSTSGAFTSNTKVFTMYLANPYSGAGNTWGATATYVGTGITPVGGGTPGAVAFYCVVTGTQTFEVWTTANFTPAINTYYNFAFETFGLSATY